MVLIRSLLKITEAFVENSKNMKNLISFILLLNFIFFASKGFAIDYVLNVSFKTTLRVEGSDRFIDAVIVLNPQHSRATILSDLEIRADVDSK